jgi:hypothetical protein
MWEVGLGCVHEVIGTILFRRHFMLGAGACSGSTRLVCCIRFDPNLGCYMTEFLPDFPWSLQENVEKIPRLGHGRFLPNSLQFIMSSIVPLGGRSLIADVIVK